MERKWGNDNAGSTAYKSAVFRDRDGSLGGGPNSYVLIHDGVNDSIAFDTEVCEIEPTWNAAVCTGDIGRLTFGGPGGFGGGGFGGAGGPGAGPGAVAGGPPRAAGPGAAGGPGGFGGAPPQPPVVLSRNGKEYTVTGTSVRAGTEIKVTTERPNVNLSLNELDKGSWVIFELPGFTTAASGTELSSLDALRQASDTSYFKDEDALWVKVVSNGDSGTGAPGGATSVQVSR
jgi:cell migration-inducing and hyaluronan-binding protein